MKISVVILSFTFIHATLAKEHLATLQAIKCYKNANAQDFISDVPPEKSLSDWLTKVSIVPKPNLSVEEILFALSNARKSPSRELIPLLKELWSHYRKSTFRAQHPDDWRSVKALDFSQVICDEIKILVKRMGGDLNDIEPVDETNTYDLNEIRIFLRQVANSPQDSPLPPLVLQSQVKNLSVIIGRCEFNASNDDHTLQLYNIIEITNLLGDQKVWHTQEADGAEHPVIDVFDQLLRKTLNRVVGEWASEPINPQNQNQTTPTAEQQTTRKKQALENTQQWNLRRLRDQILTKVSDLVKSRKSDDAFKQKMLMRFAKDDASRNFIKARLDQNE